METAGACGSSGILGRAGSERQRGRAAEVLRRRGSVLDLDPMIPAPPALDKRLLHPRAYPGLVRLGRDWDGGYVVPEDQIEACSSLVSLGLSDDVSFDKDFLHRSPKALLVGVDGRVGWGFLAKRILHASWGAVRSTLRGRTLRRAFHLDSLRGCVGLARLYRTPHRRIRAWVGHGPGTGIVGLDAIFGLVTPPAPEVDPGPDVFLKMDVEGAEYALVPDLIRLRNRIRCIVVEFHAWDERVEEFNRAMGALTEHFAVVHVHGNNWGTVDGPSGFPTTVELTMVSRVVLPKDLPPSAADYPIEGLDRPCNPGVTDIPFHFP